MCGQQPPRRLLAAGRLLDPRGTHARHRQLLLVTGRWENLRNQQNPDRSTFAVFVLRQ